MRISQLDDIQQLALEKANELAVNPNAALVENIILPLLKRVVNKPVVDYIFDISLSRIEGVKAGTSEHDLEEIEFIYDSRSEAI